MAGVELQVTVYRAGQKIGVESFRERHIVVGRDPTMADLVIGSGKVSREHVLLEHDEERIFVHDLASTNGLYLNGLRVDRAEVSASDSIYIGEHALRVSLTQPKKGAGVVNDKSTSSAQPVFFDDTVPRDVPGVGRRPGTVRFDDIHALLDDAIAAIDVELHKPHREEPSPPFPFVQSLLAEADDLPAKAAAMRLALLKAHGERPISHVLLRRRERFTLKPWRRSPHWAHIPSPAMFSARFTSLGLGEVQIPQDASWMLRRGNATWDETTGVREGWARRRRGTVWVTFKPGEILSLLFESAQYHLRFVPAPQMPPTKRRRSAWARLFARQSAFCLGISALLHTLVLLGFAIMQSKGSTNVLAPPSVWVTYDSTSAILPGLTETPQASRVPAAPPQGAMTASPTLGLRVPGGSHGYRLAGFLEAPPTYDPQVPAPGKDLVLKRAAAFLRGDGTGFGLLIPAAGLGSQWRLAAPSPADVVSSDVERVPPGAVEVQVMRIHVRLENCFQQHAPSDVGLNGRVVVNWRVDSRGRVKDVSPGTAPVSDALLRCLGDALKTSHVPGFKGTDVTLNYTFVFKRLGFETF